ncbi:MAG TPA: class I SAM-dependent methyltransferase [Vicinamibacterales bacterium]|nr:class I SAM-dependent methyltransferase [Vicinamibacterales bacterium]
MSTPDALEPVSAELQTLVGAIDIYLFDQLLRGAFDARRRVLDAGCGGGRNLPYFLQRGYDICAVDLDPAAVAAVRRLLARLAPQLPADNVVQGAVEALPWPDGAFDAVLASALLHFADDEVHFGRMVSELWRVLAPGGLFFARLASSIGLEARLPAARGRMRLPDGTDRFVADEPLLLEWTARLGGALTDPLKTTIVQGQRCMTTWCVEKRLVRR